MMRKVVRSQRIVSGDVDFQYECVRTCVRHCVYLVYLKACILKGQAQTFKCLHVARVPRLHIRDMQARQPFTMQAQNCQLLS